MNRASLLSVLLGVSLISGGCALFPKKVEFLQDKVHKMPAPTPAQVELTKEAALKADQKAQETLLSAEAAHVATNIVASASETKKLTAVVSDAVGQPTKDPTSKQTDDIVSALRSRMGALENRLDSFAKENDKDAGKKIEGTGKIQMNYFLFVGAFIFVVVVAWHLLHTALSLAAAANPAAAVGSIAVGAIGSAVSKGASSFVSWVEKEVTDPALKQKVLNAYQTAHSDVSAVLQHVAGHAPNGSPYGRA